jgi:hypothetical protein
MTPLWPATCSAPTPLLSTLRYPPRPVVIMPLVAPLVLSVVMVVVVVVMMIPPVVVPIDVGGARVVEVARAVAVATAAAAAGVM